MTRSTSTDALRQLISDDPYPTMRKLFRVFAHWQRLSAVIWQEYELNANERQFMTHIIESGPVGVVQVAQWIGITTATATIMSTRLEERGLCIRTPHPTDGRRVLLYPSKPAVLHQRDALATAGKGIENLLRELPQQERKIVRRFLELSDAILISELPDDDDPRE